MLTASRSDYFIGYWIWPKLGFNAPLPAAIKIQLPHDLAAAVSVLDLYARKEGVEWWRENGVTLRMSFDLSANSRSNAVFDAYLKDQGFSP